MSSVRLLLLGTVAAGLWAPTPSRAQVRDTLPPPDTVVFRVEGIRVQASRPVTTVGGASAVEVTLDSLAIPAAATAEQVLRELPMLHVRTNSRGEAEVTVRGSESRQVAVLYDGVPLTLSWDGRTDVSVLPVGAAEDVTFVRGLATLLHGPNVLGGVVEMNVGRGERYRSRPSVTAGASVDQTGGYGLRVSGDAPFDTRGGEGMVRVGGGFRDSPGFPLPGGVAEPVDTGDDLRLNSDATSVNGFLALRHRWDGGTWGSVSASSFKARRGIGAELGTDDARFWRYPDVRRTIVALSGGTGERETRWGRGDVEASVGVDVGSTEIHSYTSRAYDQVDGVELGDSRTATLRLLADHTLGSRADLRGSFTFSDISHDLTEDGVTEAYQQRLTSLAGETIVRLVEGSDALRALRLSVGAAWDRGSTPRTGGRESLGTLDDWGARAGLSALLGNGGTLLHAGASRRGRFPSLRESYSEALNRFAPNPDLRPEHLVSVEGGITTRVGNGDLQLVGFHNQLDGAIRRITLPGALPGEPSLRQRVNADELTSTGVELLFSQTFGTVGVGGDLTLQRVELTDPGTAVSSEPENMPERSGSVYVRVPLVAGFNGTAELEYTGAQFCQDPDSGADVELDGGSWFNTALSRVWDLSSSRSLGSRMETRASVSNLGDTTLYDQCGLPRAGRLFQLSVRVF